MTHHDDRLIEPPSLDAERKSGMYLDSPRRRHGRGQILGRRVGSDTEPLAESSCFSFDVRDFHLCVRWFRRRTLFKAVGELDVVDLSAQFARRKRL